jgi:hypothetical protein
VSELRKPRPSRKTPGAGVPSNNVLQAIVGSAGAEPMPAPAAPRPPRNEDSAMETLTQQPSPLAARANLPTQPPPQAPHLPPTQPQPAQMQPPTQQQAAQMPTQIGPPIEPYNGQPMPPPGAPQQVMPPHLQQYGMPPPQGYPPPYGAPPYGYPQGAPPYPPYQQMPPGAPYQMSPGALYPNQMHPFGAPPQPMSLTGQMRLLEADEIPRAYKLTDARWVKLVIAGVIAVSVAAATTFFIIRSTRDSAPPVGSIHVESNPPGAEVSYDGTRLAGHPTPMTIDAVPVGTRHEIRVEYPRHTAYVETVDIPKTGGEIPVSAILKPITGKMVINTVPGGADVYINGQLRGHTPTTITDIDMDAAKKVEIRLKGYLDYEQDLTWPANGEIDIDKKLAH